MSEELWDFEDDGDTLRQSLVQYNAPITKHTCSKICASASIYQPYNHEQQDIFDDFGLSQRQREVMHMEIIRAKGRDDKERTLIRQFQSTLDGSYLLRLQTVCNMTVERMGDLRFDTIEEVQDYYNYAVEIFQFDKSLKVLPEKDNDPFSALDNTNDVFEDLTDDDPFSDLDDFFDDLFD